MQHRHLTRSPRLGASRKFSAFYALTMVVFLSLATVSDDGFTRFAAGFILIAFSFQFWSYAVMVGERRAGAAMLTEHDEASKESEV